MTKTEFTWISFYEEMAGKLLEYEDRRGELLNIIYSLPKSLTKYLSYSDECFFDIDPFSVFAMFNRGNLKAETRERYLVHFKEKLGIEAEIPQDYDGLPVMYFIQAFFLTPNRTDDINVLWDLYKAVVNGGEYQDCLTRALTIKNIGDPITFGMFWVRPKVFISLDKNNREYLGKHGIEVPEKYDGNHYSHVLEAIKEKQAKGEIEESTIAEISYNAWIEANRKITFSSVLEIKETKKTMINENITKYIQLLKQKKNIILQGAPGTGKTYTTAEIAVAMCDKEFKDFEDHGKVMERYEALRKEYRIEFCTFHQSMDYEDFVEGLKPIVLEDGKGITYKPDDGIFKQISDNARRIITKQTNKEIDFDNVRVFKMSLGEVASEEGQTIYDYCLENNVVCLGWGGNTDFSDCQKREDFKAKCNDWGAVALEIFKTWMHVGDIIIVSNGNKKFRAIARITGEYKYAPEPEIGVCQFRDVEWLYKGDDIPVEKIMDKQFSQQSIYGLYATVKGAVKNSVNSDFINSIITGKVEQSHENYVLIIDEINRGNVSKIFGELITLLEADKRTGEKTIHPITVTLPYSKKPFSVPDNLYIIGTMNTTDRSTGTIDYAVRRRFAFVTLEANKDIIEKKESRDLFDQVQDFIKIRIADENFDMSDLMVGHSYFMTADGEDIKLKMEYEVIPLIKEYIKDGIITSKKDEDDEYFKCWKNGVTYQKPNTVKAAGTE